MGKIDKAIERIKQKPKDFTYQELKTVLESFGYEEKNKGKTSGSRVCFVHKSTKGVIMLHKPHPGNIIKAYALKEVLDRLKEEGNI